MQRLNELYKRTFGHDPDTVTQLPVSGSHRTYYRIGSDPQVIGVVGTDKGENDAFVYLDRCFRNVGLPVPEVYAVDSDGMRYLQQDLGSVALSDLIASNSPQVRELLEAVVRLLPAIQIEGGAAIDYGRCFPVSSLDRRSVMWDLNYFKYCFAKGAGAEIDEPALEDDLDTFTSDILAVSPGGFMYRDFQSRNIMVNSGRTWLIDFQGGRFGPCHYDLASLLWQAKAHFSPELREAMVNVYIDTLKQYVPELDEARFRSDLRLVVLFRTLQVLGCYGFRGLIERKQQFIDSIPGAIANLAELLEQGVADRYPALKSVLEQLVVKQSVNIPSADGVLTVRVMSFSYKVGIPADASGNGGGFVFDCRAVHNPGRYDEYKALTGLDEPVIRFLENDGEITTFLSHCYALVDAAVDRYRKRGFTSLMVCFGCTGGRHRSVYSAQHMAEHLHEYFPDVRVRLEHRERGITQMFDVNI